MTDRQTDGQTDRRTDGQTDGRPGKNNMSPDPEGGRHNYQPIRYLFNVISLEMNLPIYKTLKGVHMIIWKAKKAVGQLRRYNILVIYLQSEELAETCLPSFLVYFITVTVHSD